MWITSNCVGKIIPHKGFYTDKGMIKACVDTLAALHNIFLLIFWGRQNSVRLVGSHGYYTVTCTPHTKFFEKLLHVSKWAGSKVPFMLHIKKKMNRKSQDLPWFFQELPLLKERPGPSLFSMRPFLGPFPSPWGASPLSSCRCACLSSQECPATHVRTYAERLGHI